jgi:hypothetical protein
MVIKMLLPKFKALSRIMFSQLLLKTVSLAILGTELLRLWLLFINMGTKNLKSLLPQNTQLLTLGAKIQTSNLYI